MIEIKNFTKQYKDKLAVDNLSINIEAGCIHGFIGHNGAGKTTTLKALMGILDFEEGEIKVNGLSVKENPLKTKEIMAYIPDNPDIYTYMKGIDYINFICDAYKVDKAIRAHKISYYANMFEIYDVLNDAISSYSHGMRQKLVIIAAMVHEPKVLVLDEPFVGLDPKASHLMKGLMREVCNKGGCVFFSTHVLEVAQSLCDNISIIKQGRLIISGKTEEVVKDKSLEEIFLDLN